MWTSHSISTAVVQWWPRFMVLFRDDSQMFIRRNYRSSTFSSLSLSELDQGIDFVTCPMLNQLSQSARGLPLRGYKAKCVTCRMYLTQGSEMPTVFSLQASSLAWGIGEEYFNMWTSTRFCVEKNSTRSPGTKNGDTNYFPSRRLRDTQRTNDLFILSHATDDLHFAKKI